MKTPTSPEMPVSKKVVKFVEEKEMNKLKKMHRSKERNTKYTEKDTKETEDPPQEPEALKCPKHHFRPISPPMSRVKVEIDLETIIEPSVHFKQEEGEGWESDGDDWFE